MKKEENLIHLEFIGGPWMGQHHYFGSIAAIYDSFTNEELGVTKGRVYCFNVDNDRPYMNKLCIIRKGVILRKKGERVAPVKVIRVI